MKLVTAVHAFAQRHAVPLLTFEPKQRKDDVVAAYRRAFTGREGVVVAGVARRNGLRRS